MAFYNQNDEFFSDNHNSSAFNRSATMHSEAHNNSLEKSRINFPLQRSNSIKELYNSSFESVKGKVKKLCSFFEPPRPAYQLQQIPQLSSSNILKPTKSFNADPFFRLPDTEDRVVIYFTSLRSIRRTHEDCYAVRMIFWGFRVNVDERDVSMDSEFRKELQLVLGEKNVSLPQVFIKGKYIGGADIVRHMHEIGELAKLVKELPVRVPGYVCEGCGDVRFVPCLNCNGSKKIFDEDDEQMKRCPECNENGLIRCPNCCP